MRESHTFYLRDKYDGSDEEIFHAALESGARHAESNRWKNFSIERTIVPAFQDDYGYVLHEFTIRGETEYTEGEDTNG